MFINLMYCSIFAMGPIHAAVESLELNTLSAVIPVLETEFAVFVAAASCLTCWTSSWLNVEVQSFGRGVSMAR